MARTAVLLAAFGGPETIDQVGPFMTKLMGRPPAPAVLERVVSRYQEIGGGSPLPRTVRKQAAALEELLAAEGLDVPVRAAFQYAAPSIQQIVDELASQGFERIVGLSASPHNSRVTTGAYFDDLRKAADRAGLSVAAARSFHAHPDFLRGIAASARLVYSAFSNPAEVFVIFSAHSLPVEYIEGGDPYVRELQATVSGVLDLLPPLDSQIAYQSRGMGQGKWLEPTVETVLERLAAEGQRQVLLVPAGFTADHVETLYDIDIAIAAKARDLGLEFRRSAAMNVDPLFIGALYASVRPVLGN